MDIKVTDTSTGRLIKNQVLADKLAALHNTFRGRVIEKLAFLFPYLPENHGGLLPRWLLVVCSLFFFCSDLHVLDWIVLL
jgi:hypothetical protein